MKDSAKKRGCEPISAVLPKVFSPASLLAVHNLLLPEPGDGAAWK